MLATFQGHSSPTSSWLGILKGLIQSMTSLQRIVVRAALEQCFPWFHASTCILNHVAKLLTVCIYRYFETNLEMHLYKSWDFFWEVSPECTHRPTLSRRGYHPLFGSQSIILTLGSKLFLAFLEMASVTSKLSRSWDTSFSGGTHSGIWTVFSVGLPMGETYAISNHSLIHPAFFTKIL